ncbi:MAG: type II secretion system F family protein [Planctomycetota bacterium]
MPANAAWLLVPAGIGLVAVWRFAATASMRRRARGRLFAEARRSSAAPVMPQRVHPEDEAERGWSSWLEAWLSVSGFRGSGAVQSYLLQQGVALVLATIIAFVVATSSYLAVGREWLLEIPGGLGDFLAPILTLGPLILFLVIGSLPLLRVRARRQAIVQSVEQDLPMTLALLATLVESGLGFDAAIERILKSMDPGRPLASELRLFRSETQAGVSRLECFRALARRLDVISVSTFVSAMVHSENVGGGVAESLRRQADEVWSRRREIAIQRAQTLPTKLAVPLVLCFLPGIFVYTFGPALAEFLRIADGVMSGAQ